MLGANDRIVSVAGLMVAVMGALRKRGPIVTAGIAGLVAGASATPSGVSSPSSMSLSYW